jgi:hypothetical protein
MRYVEIPCRESTGSPSPPENPTPSLPPEPESTESNSHLGRGTSERCVVSCARSVTHRRVRALACSSPPSAHLVPHPDLLCPIGGSGLRGGRTSYAALAEMFGTTLLTVDSGRTRAPRIRCPIELAGSI